MLNAGSPFCPLRATYCWAAVLSSFLICTLPKWLLISQLHSTIVTVERIGHSFYHIHVGYYFGIWEQHSWIPSSKECLESAWRSTLRSCYAKSKHAPSVSNLKTFDSYMPYFSVCLLDEDTQWMCKISVFFALSELQFAFANRLILQVSTILNTSIKEIFANWNQVLIEANNTLVVLTRK